MSLNKDWIRPAAVAGTFYPGDPDRLGQMLDEFCPKPTEKKVTAVMAPHAGYIYSGKIAGAVYERVTIPDEVLLICPNHTGEGPRISVWAKGAWETPLGRVPVAEDLASRLLARVSDAVADQRAHLFEHANEVHLPFLRHRNPNVRIVPVVLGRLSIDAVERFGDALADLLDVGATPLIVASTDMSHYIARTEATACDHRALDAVAKIDGRGLYETVTRERISMCGFIPTAAALQACRQKKCRESVLVAYGDSGDRTGDLDSVVGYASAYIA